MSQSMQEGRHAPRLIRVFHALLNGIGASVTAGVVMTHQYGGFDWTTCLWVGGIAFALGAILFESAWLHGYHSSSEAHHALYGENLQENIHP